MRGGIFQLLSAVLVCASATPAAAALDERECRIGMEGSARVLAQCATLIVPADPENPEGEQLELAVVRVPALAATPQGDPLVMIQGGPGGSSIDMYLSMRGALNFLRRDRDVIVMDQRGTGRSMQGLECKSPEDVDFQIAQEELLRELLEICLNDIERDPRFYTTSLAVRDLEALRAEYGFEQWNVYGVSYGTRVAQHYVRRYPDRVRSVVLDGSVPAPLVLGPHIPLAAQSAFDEILARCEQDDTCSQQFGDLNGKFAELRERLETQDITVSRLDPETGELLEVPLGVDALLGLTRMMSYSALTAALLPLTIDTAWAGRYDVLADQAELILGDVDRSMNIAMHNSVICSEDWPRFADDTVPDASATYLGSSMTDALDLMCETWPTGPVDEDFFEPLVTDVPVLFISGSSDPATPAEHVEQIIDGGVGNSLHIVVEEQGHGVFALGCMPQIAERFINAASVEGLDVSCIEDTLPTPFFLTPAGPAP